MWEILKYWSLSVVNVAIYNSKYTILQTIISICADFSADTNILEEQIVGLMLNIDLKKRWERNHNKNIVWNNDFIQREKYSWSFFQKIIVFRESFSKSSKRTENV